LIKWCNGDHRRVNGIILTAAMPSLRIKTDKGRGKTSQG